MQEVAYNFKGSNEAQELLTWTMFFLMIFRNRNRWNRRVYSTLESGIAGKAGIVGTVVIESDELWIFIPNGMIYVPFELE